MLTRLKRKLLLDCRLYLILDKDSCAQGDVVGVLRRVDKSDIDFVQLRENTACDRDFLQDAKIVKQVCQRRGIVFLINNRLDIAQIVDADGLHLGQSDLPLEFARRILGDKKIIGISCRNFTQARQAEAKGADYISIGPAFRTKTKANLRPINLRLIEKVRQKIKIPFFVIGGINESNIKKVKHYKVEKAALCRAICRAKNAAGAAKRIRKLLVG